MVTGAGGLLGGAVVKLASSRHEVYSGYREHAPLFGIPTRLNLLDSDALARTVEATRPEVILHTAAMTDVDKCETERGLATATNQVATGALSRLASRVRAHFVYVSTDYVFDGRKGLYDEGAEAAPLNFYGKTKSQGEKETSRRGKGYCIARTSVIYGSKPAAGKTNFALWLIDKLRRLETANVLVDQIVSPSLNTSVAEALLEIAERRLEGIIHVAGSSRVSRFEFASELASTFELDGSLLIKSRMEAMAWVARRPKDSSLDVSKASRLLAHRPLGLIDSLGRLRDEMSE